MPENEELNSQEDPNNSPPTSTEEPKPQDQPKSTEVPTNNLQAELAELNRRALADLHRQNQELQAKLAEQNKTPQHSPEEDSKLLFQDPRKLIREELSSIVAPLLEFRQEYGKQQAYERLKNELAQVPNLYNIYKDIAPYVDEAMRNSEPTLQNMQAAILSIYGAKQAGLLPNSQPKPVEKPSVSNNPNPPHLPPSAPAPPRASNNNQPKTRELTEAERDIARRFNMTPEQYINYLEADSDVGTWKGIK
jgi:hypothetical protein